MNKRISTPDSYTQMFIMAQKNLDYPNVHKQVNGQKNWYKEITECYSAIKRNTICIIHHTV